MLLMIDAQNRDLKLLLYTKYWSIVVGEKFFEYNFPYNRGISFIDFDYKKVLIFNIISKIAELKILLN